MFSVQKNTSILKPNVRFQELDALRGIAALSVLLFHYSMPFQDKLIFKLFKYGVSGVDLFFIISGFVVFMSVSNAKNSWEFLINRFTRLFPTYWTAVTFTFILIILNEYYLFPTNFDLSKGWESYLYNLTMFQYYFEIPDLDGPYWTMIIEMIFYLLMFVLMLTKSVKSTVPILVLLIISSALITEFYKGWGGELYTDYFMNFPLSQFIPLFLAGILFYQLKNAVGRQLMIILLILSCYFVQIILFKSGGRSSGYILHSEYKVVVGVYFVFMFLFAYNKLGWIVNRATLYLGKISFALYLIHQYLSINVIIPHLMKIGVNFHIAAYLIALPTCILIASLITFYVEKPVSPWLRKKLSGWLLHQLPNWIKNRPFVQRLFYSSH
jgi:peptidoglycan/LPS O-acetylase OafA/YrhL